MALYPLLMAPHFRSGSKTPWGGTMLRDVFMKDAPEGAGASLEVCTLPGQESMVAAGPHAGKTLSKMVELWGRDLTGLDDGSFPLMVELLDAQQNLSVQVSPEDGPVKGKRVGWVILNAEPGAKIVYGLEAEGADLKALVDEGRVGECLHYEVVRPGDVFYIPCGMVHALCAGIQAYEIQDSTDLYYRLWDWDRAEKRELHPEEALKAASPELHLSRNEGTTVLCRGGSRTYYISDSHFELCRLNLSGKMPLESGRMLFLTALAPCTLHWDDEEMEIAPCATVVVPAGLEGAVLSGNAKVLMASLPQQEKLRQELGYRAENVAGL